MTDTRKKLAKLYASCESHFDKLYAPEKKPLVYGFGSAQSAIMLVGEAPGEKETLEGKPFVGKAGKILDEFLLKTGLEKNAVFITNVVKLRPTSLSKAGRIVNRAPSKEEIALFSPWLQKEIDILKPKLIVTLGNVPFQTLCGMKGAVIGKWHGEPIGTKPPLFALYHPAAIIYNRALREPYENDLIKLKEYITLLKLYGDRA